MSTLDFKGKSFIYTHHLGVPYRELLVVPEKSSPTQGRQPDLDDNLIIHGDNLEALKALLPRYAGKVDCIFIDPPYNIGSEGWAYNDAVNSPLMREWVRKNAPVDKEDLERHDKWLCMMWPRLQLLKELLAEDGAIFVCINDVEVHRLRCLLDELWGEENFLATLVWEKGKKGDSKFFSNTHEYILAYAQNKEGLVKAGTKWRVEKEGADEVLAKYEKLKKEIKNDHAAIRAAMLQWYGSLPADAPARNHSHYNWSDDRGLYFAADLAGPDDGRKDRPRHDIFHIVTGRPCAKPSTGWRWDEARTKRALAAKPPLIHFGSDETTIPNRKTYLKDVTGEALNTVFYKDGRAATLQVEQILGEGVFQYPKDTEIVAKLISACCDETAVILDSFMGSGTTFHSVLSLNAADAGMRKFIGIQLPEPIKPDSKAAALGFKEVADITRTRVQKVIQGYKAEIDVTEELYVLNLNWSEIKKGDRLVEKVESIVQMEGAAYPRTRKEVKEGVLRVLGIHSKEEEVPGLGGSFTYVELGEAMDLERLLAETPGSLPSFASLARYLFFTSTGSTLPATETPAARKPAPISKGKTNIETAPEALAADAPVLIGETAGWRIYLHYRPDEAWLRSPAAAFTRTHAEALDAAKKQEAPGKQVLVFAAAKYISHRSLRELCVDFAQLPYALHRVQSE